MCVLASTVNRVDAGLGLAVCVWYRKVDQWPVSGRNNTSRWPTTGHRTQVSVESKSKDKSMSAAKMNDFKPM